MVTLPDGYPADAFEAFAFLKTRTRLDIEDLKVLAMIECYGEAFYQILVAGVGHAEARALLGRNGAEERGHAHRVLKAIRLLGGEPFELPAVALYYRTNGTDRLSGRKPSDFYKVQAKWAARGDVRQ